MWLNDLINSIQLFIVLNPFETTFFLAIICTWTGSYLESVFKFWDWGPQCNKCNEWTLWNDTKIHCTKCDDHRSNDIWEEGYAHGERGVGGLK